MKSSDLRAVWDAPDNTRLMKRQTSVRLATHVGARIGALCDLYPAKSKSQIINDLLSAALDDFENGLEFVPGDEKEQDFDGHQAYEIEPDIGRRTRYLELANEQLKNLEAEIGNDEPNFFTPVRWRKVGAK